jgi:tetratricopeptide (TPR) repeat protein
MALGDRGVASREGDDRESARVDFIEAERIAGEVPSDDDFYDDAQFQVAWVSSQFGELLAKKFAQLEEAEERYERARKILDRLIKDHRSVPYYREEMAATLSGRALVRLAKGRAAEALADCKTASEQLETLIEEQTADGGRDNPSYLSLLGRTLELEARIAFSLSKAGEGRKLLERARAKLDRASKIDPARAIDKALLETIESRLASEGK